MTRDREAFPESFRDDALAQAFKGEAFDILSELENTLIELEGDPENPEAVSSIFRGFHTIKGSGAMLSFDEVSRFTHQLENVYDLVRNGKIVPDKPLIDLTLSACDLIRDMIEEPDSGGKFDARSEGILLTLRRLCKLPGAEEEAGQGRKEAIPESPEPEEKNITYRIRFRPAPEVFQDGTNPLLLLEELRAMGECRVVAQMSDIPQLHMLDPEECYTYWDIILTTDKGINAIRDVFIFIQDSCELKIDIIDDGETSLEDKDYKKLGEILVEKQDITPQDLERVLEERGPIGELLIKEGLIKPTNIQAALAEQEHVRQLREERLRNEVISSIKVSSDKLDKLVNLVGELVTVQARLTQTSVRRDDPELISISEEVERLTAELRDITMNVRMLPIGTTFSKFKRLIRDLSNELGKEAELITDGGETELDKTIIEKLNDPLVHIIRNCMDHGIELPAEREKAGKPRRGTVHLAAIHSGDHVIIQIRDDGAGLDSAAIREKAVSRGLISADDILSEEEIFPLIFLPGFTTAKTVTNVSGRGVGMDVVKKAVDALRGTIHVESHYGMDTTITLMLPLTLAIIEGLLVKIAEKYFVLPLQSVEECVELTREDRARSHGRNVANVRGQVVPFIRLREQFMIRGEAPSIEQIVIVKTESQRLGLVVDSVIGGQQTVIKSLGKVFRGINEISGATILGDGTVALIIDIAKVAGTAEQEEVTG